VLEKVPGIELYQVGDFETWRGVARWLRRMHEAFRERTLDAARAAPLIHYDKDFYARWLERARSFASTRGRAAVQALDEIARGYDAVIDRLASLPATFIHGEFYASNVLVDESSARVCPVDWELCALGPGLIDLAALTAGKWTDEERAALVAAYDDSIPRDAMECCRLHLAVQWLGWSPQWSPPAEHEHDWLTEATRCARRLRM
jgi:Ser/Thr protein kinase RdoA (MazF antagonist)